MIRRNCIKKNAAVKTAFRKIVVGKNLKSVAADIFIERDGRRIMKIADGLQILRIEFFTRSAVETGAI